MDQLAELRVGDIVSNKFRLVRLLGHGATSHVYAAQLLEKPDVLVALKILRATLSLHRAFVKRFEREGRIVQLVKSKFFARFLGADLDDAGRFWMAFELFEGQSLDRLLPPGKAKLLQGSDDIRWIARDALSGLRDAHAAQIVHRDVKPSNIFIRLRSDGTLRAILLDFGVSKLLEMPGGGHPSALTIVGTSIGTPDYMPPEQLRDATTVDARADIYSLGVVVYFFLTGRLPFQGRSVAERSVWKQSHDPLSLRDGTGVDWPQLLEAFLRRALARSPADRYPCALDALLAWEKVIASIAAIELPRPGGSPEWSATTQTKSDLDESSLDP